MKRLRAARILALGLAGALCARLWAQSALYVQDDTKAWLRVRSARESRPLVLKGGELSEVGRSPYMLKGVDEYAPYTVTVRDMGLMEMDESYGLPASGHAVPLYLEARGHFESSAPLDRVFVLVAVETGSGRKGFFIQGIGRLEPYKPALAVVTIPLDAKGLRSPKYEVHVFSDGSELLSTMMTAAYRESMLDAMVLRRIANVGEANPRPFAGPTPRYPADLAKAGSSGKATIRMRIGPNGAVFEESVVSATDPAYGASAMEAAKAWRFIPRVRGGVPVESAIVMPFSFAYAGP